MFLGTGVYFRPKKSLAESKIGSFDLTDLRERVFMIDVINLITPIFYIPQRTLFGRSASKIRKIYEQNVLVSN